jgi:hypothetical protein
MSTWNRRVTATGDGLHLQVDEDTPNPNPAGRNDGSNYITVQASDRPATIRYIGSGVTLSGIRMKDDSPVPAALTVAIAGQTMTLTDSGAAGTDYSYYLVGSYGANSGIETEDPQIHNTP